MRTKPGAEEHPREEWGVKESRRGRRFKKLHREYCLFYILWELQNVVEKP